MATLSYNGISFPFQKTDQFTQEPIRTPDGADYLHTQIAIQVTATITADTPGVLAVGETFADALARIRHTLEKPRRPLVFVVDGVTVRADASSDVANGPFPKVLAITRLTGANAAMVQFSVTCHLNECPEGGGGGPVISHRWEESSDIDADQLTVRERNGTLVIRGGQGFSPDAFRHVVSPPIPTGFVRTRSHYAVRSDGLALTYSFRDEERYALPPPGTTRAEGSFKVTTSNGSRLMAEVSVRLAGNVTASKTQLVAKAVIICTDKLERAGLLKDKKGRWQASASIGEQLWKNEVEVSFRATIKNPKRPIQAKPDTQENSLTSVGVGLGGLLIGSSGFTAGAVAAISPSSVRPGTPEAAAQSGFVPKVFGLDAFGPPKFSEGVPSPDPGMRGTAGLRLVAAALNDPCLVETVTELEGGKKPIKPQFNESEMQAGRLPNIGATELSAGSPSGDAVRLPAGSVAEPVKAIVEVVAQLPDVLKQAEPFLAGGIYSYYKIMLRYEEDNNQAVLTEQKESGLTHFIPLSGQTLRLIAEWSAERAGEPPQLPPKKPGSSDTNTVYLRGAWDPCTLDLAEDGVTLLYRTSGRYEYGFKDPSKVNTGAAVPPWLAELMGLDPLVTITDGPEVIDTDSAGTSVLSSNPNRTPDWQQNLNKWLNGQ